MSKAGQQSVVQAGDSGFDQAATRLETALNKLDATVGAVASLRQEQAALKAQCDAAHQQVETLQDELTRSMERLAAVEAEKDALARTHHAAVERLDAAIATLENILPGEETDHGSTDAEGE